MPIVKSIVMHHCRSTNSALKGVILFLFHCYHSSQDFPPWAVMSATCLAFKWHFIKTVHTQMLINVWTRSVCAGKFHYCQCSSGRPLSGLHAWPTGSSLICDSNQYDTVWRERKCKYSNVSGCNVLECVSCNWHWQRLQHPRGPALQSTNAELSLRIRGL